MEETTKKKVIKALKIPKQRLILESYELYTIRHSSDSKYISSSCWNEMASRMQDIGIATMYKGAFSLSLSKWLSKAKAIEATDRAIATCIMEFWIRKQVIFINQRPDRTSSGTKHSMTLVSIYRGSKNKVRERTIQTAMNCTYFWRNHRYVHTILCNVEGGMK